MRRTVRSHHSNHAKKYAGCERNNDDYCDSLPDSPSAVPVFILVHAFGVYAVSPR